MLLFIVRIAYFITDAVLSRFNLFNFFASWQKQMQLIKGQIVTMTNITNLFKQQCKVFIIALLFLFISGIPIKFSRNRFDYKGWCDSRKNYKNGNFNLQNFLRLIPISNNNYGFHFCFGSCYGFRNGFRNGI